jgi:hypothetical protein
MRQSATLLLPAAERNFRQEQEISFYPTASRLALGRAQSPIKYESEGEGLLSGVKRPGHEAAHSPPLSPTASWRGA